MYFLFDIGGTSIRLALLEDINSQINVTKIPTPTNFYEGMNNIREYLEKNNAIGKIRKAIGGAPGVIDQSKSILINARNLKDWNHKHLKGEMMKITDSDVRIENDAALGALGEATEGIGKEYEIVVYVTVSTGIGGSRIVNKQFENFKVHFEIGQQVLSTNGGLRYLEDIASGTGLFNRYGLKAEEITDHKVWEEVEYYLALGLNNIIVHWTPDIVVIGGAVGRRLNLDNVRNRVRDIMRIYPELPVIQKSTLRHNGIHGARYLLNS